MVNCKQASELMSQSMDAPLPFGKKISLKFHLMMCHGCTNFLSQISFLHKVVSHFDTCGHCESMHLSDEAKKRIQETLLKQQDKVV